MNPPFYPESSGSGTKTKHAGENGSLTGNPFAVKEPHTHSK
ncbi:hypothetical protein B4098_1348 [Heyndrickxia coagulans]|uniref:Uncharacterized protein n=1 Tax=Heyndrickxia coagulans TaxID=1398 RepID=A0A150KJB0_HEYCO|nr:hypothetical protein B4098_1348 [Heyndrickxia coagulans]KYC72981.1 hypothetical protein B4099_1437 [Heyndrickxia coagulans]